MKTKSLSPKSFKMILESAKQVCAKYSPEILLGLGISGLISSTILAVKSTPKALSLIEEAKKSKPDDQKFTKVDIVKSCWRCYIPSAIATVASVTCIIGASSIHAKRLSALTAAYKISEAALSEYKDKVVETIGSKKTEDIENKIDSDHINKNPVSTNHVFKTNMGNTLFYDDWSGRYFEADIDKIKRIENSLNKNIIQDMFGYVSLNEFYEEIGLDPIGMGEDFGWSVDNIIDLRFGSQITDTNQPCVVLRFNKRPTYDYNK